MAAKPRLTVRLAPSHLHGLAYLAAILETTPAELARTLLSPAVQEQLAIRGLTAQCQDHYRAWLDQQGQGAPRAEVPDQRDYDRLAVGELAGPLDSATARGLEALDDLPARPLEGLVQHPLSQQQIRSIYAADRAKLARR